MDSSLRFDPPPSPKGGRHRDPLPPGSALIGLPDNIAGEFQKLARFTIRSRFVPYLWLRQAKRHRRTFRASRAALYNSSAIVSVLKHSPVLSQWPDGQLQTLARGATVRAFRRGEIVGYAREPCAPSMMFLLAGSVEELKPSDAQTLIANAAPAGDTAHGHSFRTSLGSFVRQQTTPTKGTAIAMPVGVLKAGAVLCDAATMAHDCRATFLVAADENVDVVEVPRHVVVAAFEQLPQNITAPLLREAALQREATLTTSAPMTATRVRLSRIFGSLNPNGVSFVAKRATPVCFTPGSVIVSRDKIPLQAYFVRRGYVALLDAAQRRVAVLRDGASLCEQEFFFGEKPQYTAVAISNVDLYTLRQVDFQALKASDVHCRALNAAANDERQRELQAVRENRSDMLLDSVRSIPIFNLFATPQAIADIAAAMTPRVLNSPDLITTTANSCDRLVILTRGSALVRTNDAANHKFALGECIGYTCLVEHRWLYAVVALEAVDVWELPREEYMTILRRHRIYKQILGATRQLLQPLLQRPDRCEAMEPIALALPQPNSFPHLRTPNLHPTTLENKLPQFHPWKPASPTMFDMTTLTGAKMKKFSTLKRKHEPVTSHSKKDVGTSLTRVPKAQEGGLLRVTNELLLDTSLMVADDQDRNVSPDKRAAAQNAVNSAQSRTGSPKAETRVEATCPDVCVGLAARSCKIDVDPFGNVMRTSGLTFPAAPLNAAGARMSRQQGTVAHDDDGTLREGDPRLERTTATPTGLLSQRGLFSPTAEAAESREAAVAGAGLGDEEEPTAFDGELQLPTEADESSLRLRTVMKQHRDASAFRALQMSQLIQRHDQESKPPVRRRKHVPRPPSAMTMSSGRVSKASGGAGPLGSSMGTPRPTSAAAMPRPPLQAAPPQSARAYRTPCPPSFSPRNLVGRNGRFAEPSRVASASSQFGSLLGKMSAAVPGFAWHSSAAGVGAPRAMMAAYARAHRAEPDVPPAAPPPASLDDLMTRCLPAPAIDH
jgi:CRP-like cAMP-binding protein